MVLRFRNGFVVHFQLLYNFRKLAEFFLHYFLAAHDALPAAGREAASVTHYCTAQLVRFSS